LETEPGHLRTKIGIGLKDQCSGAMPRLEEPLASNRSGFPDNIEARWRSNRGRHLRRSQTAKHGWIEDDRIARHTTAWTKDSKLNSVGTRRPVWIYHRLNRPRAAAIRGYRWCRWAGAIDLRRLASGRNSNYSHGDQVVDRK